ncbi:MAG TPA: MerR family transcriptional regulator [Candidatus Kapabacteria bacterium]|nr:MerR family transcriptional regulator [Candidatus Kapabacteria bacterium]
MGTQGEFFERPDTVLLHSGVSDHSATEELTRPPLPQESITLASAQIQSRRTMKDLSIPKLYYSISEVSRLTGLEPYVLRYWETEFDELRPQKNRAGNRIYSNRDIKFILRIKELLREQRYTIEGAKTILRTERFTDSKPQEEIAATSDPAQIQLPTEKPPTPQAAITLEELRAMKAALIELRAVMK